MTHRATPELSGLLSRLVLVGVAGILRCDHGWFDAEADLDTTGTSSTSTWSRV
jgi:hypothetical protein